MTSRDETGILTLAFNEMVKRINAQISEIKDKAEIERKLKDEEMENLKIKNLLKETELKALQSRINPHFLFNSLNMISQMAYIEGASQTTSLLESMNDFLRYNLDKFDKVVTIKDEIGNLKDYVYIQKKRFGERIKFEINESGEVGTCLIPCLVLQPLLENSIIHGVQTYMDNAVVGVEIARDNDRVRIRIYDNGVGIDKSKLDELGKILDKGSEDSSTGGIGLTNVIARLKLFYNNDIGFGIKSSQGKGTEIEFDIPFKKAEGENICIA